MADAEAISSLVNVSIGPQPDTNTLNCEELAIEEPTPTENDEESPALYLDHEELLSTPPAWEELKQPMVELLLKYYNNEDSDVDLIGAVAQVIEVFCKWQEFGSINSQSLLNFIIDQIVVIVGEIKNKLILKAIDKYDLLSSAMKSDTEGAPQGPMANAAASAAVAADGSLDAAVESLSAPEAPID